MGLGEGTMGAGRWGGKDSVTLTDAQSPGHHGNGSPAMSLLGAVN